MGECGVYPRPLTRTGPVSPGRCRVPSPVPSRATSLCVERKFARPEVETLSNPPGAVDEGVKSFVGSLRTLVGDRISLLLVLPWRREVID